MRKTVLLASLAVVLVLTVALAPVYNVADQFQVCVKGPDDVLLWRSVAFQ